MKARMPTQRRRTSPEQQRAGGIFIRSLLSKDAAHLTEEEKRIVARYRKRTKSGGSTPRSRKRQRSGRNNNFGSKSSMGSGSQSTPLPSRRPTPLPHEFGENSAVLLQAQRVIVNVHSAEALSRKVVEILQNYELALRRHGGELPSLLSEVS